ncbi:MAG: flagellar basal-body rod protein FlgF [Cycloclasticus sp.]|jgi:fagellar hook-basal body proteins
MLGSIYKGMAGMLSFDKGLSNISSNVANMNTNGYKKTELHFRDAMYQQKDGIKGSSPSSTEANILSTNHSQGELQATGNDTDMAINGQGYFILRDGDQTYYTRAGEFDFDVDGYLVNKGDGYRVAGLNGSSSLSDINIKNFRAIDANPSSKIELMGNLSVSGTLHNITDVEVVDVDGTRRVLNLEFTNNSAITPQSWLVEVKDETGSVVQNNLEIRFNPNGSPMLDFNSVSFSLAANSGAKSNINIFTGEPDSFNQVTNFSSGSTSSVEMESTDGNAPGVMIGMEIDQSGNIVVNYSNGESQTADKIALAYFQSLESLDVIANGMLQTNGTESPIIGAVETEGLGKIEGGKVEQSNVELTSEFTNMIVIQRGYQASSQVLTSANEMIQQLMEATSK